MANKPKITTNATQAQLKKAKSMLTAKKLPATAENVNKALSTMQARKKKAAAKKKK